MARKKYPEHILIKKAQLKMPLVNAAGFRTLRKPAPLTKHKHKGHELTYLAEGEVAWSLENGKELILSGGDLAITQPGISHSGKWQIIRPCKLFWIILNPQNNPENTIFTVPQIKVFRKVLKNSDNCVTNCSKETANAFSQQLMSMEEWDERPEDIRCLANLRLKICNTLLAIWQELEESGEAISEAPLQQQINRFLEKHIMDNIGVNDMAKYAVMHPSKFSQKFRELTGQTPADYLRRFRCKTAADILKKTGKAITDIALDMGFASSQHFARTFKKYTGMTPSTYRKSMGKHSRKE